MIAALCVRADSPYRRLGVDCFDLARDARTFAGSGPVIAHPPCRAFGRLRQFAKPRADEVELGLWCLETVRRVGGVLEHPAHSRLFSLAGVAAGAGRRDRAGGYILPVWQSWFGHRAPKPTWLYVVGVEPGDVPRLPFALGDPGGRVEFMCTAERERTPLAFARWLLDLAERAQ